MKESLKITMLGVLSIGIQSSLFAKEGAVRESDLSSFHAGQSAGTTTVDAEAVKDKVLQPYIAYDSSREDRVPGVSKTQVIDNTQATSAVISDDDEKYQAEMDQAVIKNNGDLSAAESVTTTQSNVDPLSAYSFSNPELEARFNVPMESITWLGTVNKVHSKNELKPFYLQAGGDLLWVDGEKVSPLALQLVEEINKAGDHGLNPDLYHATTFANLGSLDKIYDPIELDLLLSDAFITYKKHLSNGILNPQKLFSTWNLSPEDVAYASLFLAAKQNGNITQVFAINDKDYLRLAAEYKSLKAQATGEVQEKLADQTLKFGNRGANVQVLKRKLGVDDSSNVFDEELNNAVKLYQADNNLKPDGVVGRQTRYLLNQSIVDKIENLEINMERYRWNVVPDGNYVWVNIPGFVMEVRNHDEVLFSTKTVVGRKKRPTPVFSDMLEYVVLSPYWNVPPTIFKEDKLPRLKNDPYALGGSMQVVNRKTGKVVDPGTVDWSAGGGGYGLRQLPGANNSLGKMKFLFPNKHAIYLHDTPDKHLFKRSNRAYSSGCVRLEKAKDFANFLLIDMGWSPEQVDKQSSRRSEKWVTLDTTLNYPVYLNYLTAWVDEDKNIRYSPDIYDYDEKMKTLYKQTILENL